MPFYEVTPWLIGDNVPLRIELFQNNQYVNSQTTPTVTVYDSAGTKQIDAENMTAEATGRYIYYADTGSWPVGKCYWYALYTLSAKLRRMQSMFFIYDQATWMIIERVRDALDGLQEGELPSATIYQKYNEATRWIDRKASGGADANLVEDAYYAQAALTCYVAYLTDRERANVDIGTSALVMVTELRNYRDSLLEEITRVTEGPGEVQKGIFRPTISAMQLDVAGKKMDRGMHRVQDTRT